MTAIIFTLLKLILCGGAILGLVFIYVVLEEILCGRQ